jgi:hypothetical protein
VSYKDPEYKRNWFKKIRIRNIQELRKLREGPCSDCGGKFPWYVMEFDHVPERGKKKCAIAALTGSRRITSKSFSDELAKCDLVCANCHKIRTYKRNGSNWHNP